MEIKDISSNLNSEDEVIDFIDDEPEFEELNNEENGCPCDAFGVCPLFEPIKDDADGEI